MKDELVCNDMSFHTGRHRLRATFVKANPQKAALLFIAGGGYQPRQERYYALHRDVFFRRHITTFDFDFRGIGESEGTFEKTNLVTRIGDARGALSLLKVCADLDEVYVVGTSMGGPVAIQVAKDPSVKGLLLVNPAAYSLEARIQNFGPDFSAAIRKPESWKNSPDFDALQSYSGRIFLMYGTKDEVVPPDIFAKYAEIVDSKGESVCALEGETHNSWKDQAYAWQNLIEFIE
ncbi:MAG: alpha/beta hydrolase [Patescibacteria group bacterium]|nr:alpha/beta hydrolase [Patescibacteria group bacterium]